MRFPINRDYTDEQRLTACEVIFAAQYDPDYIRALTAYWHIFSACSIGSGLTPWQEYLILRQLAFEWFTNHRIQGLLTVLAHLPSANP